MRDRGHRELQIFGKGVAAGGAGVDTAEGFGVFDQRRRVMRFAAGIQHQRSAAAPMFGDHFTSVAGLLRVKLTHNQLFKRAAAKLASSQIVIQGN